MEQIRLTKQKIAAYTKFSNLLLDDIKINICQDGDDFLTNSLTAMIDTFILSTVNEEKTVTVHSEPPTFFDWLFRRKRKIEFNFKATEVLKDPPKLPPGVSVLIYDIKERDNI